LGGAGGTAGVGGSGGVVGCSSFDAGATGAVLLSDNFEDGNANGWLNAQTSTTGVARWAVAGTDAGSRVYAETGDLSNTIYVAANGDVAWTDVSIEARVRVLTMGGSNTSNFAGVCARVSDINNFFCAALRPSDGRIAFRARIGGSSMTLGGSIAVTPAVTTNVWYTIKLEIRGSTLNVYFNGSLTPNGTVTSSAICSGGVALAVSNVTAEFDDVRVTVP
jgi:hypothetical protein